jgi:hypothetical protein
MLVDLQGFHGTSMTSYRQMLASGVVRPTLGQLGTAFYLWEGETFGKILANCWFVKKANEGSFQGHSEPGIKIIEVNLRVESECFMDFLEPGNRRRLEAFVKLYLNGIPDVGSKHNTFFWKCLDKFINETSRRTGIAIKAVRRVVQGPVPCNNYPYAALGSPISIGIVEPSCITSMT